MRFLPFTISFIITLVLIIVLSMQLGSVPPIGKFLSPQHGLWQNAEAVDKNPDQDLAFLQLKSSAKVYFDERMVPHVFAQNEEDLYFVQGYLHAKFRLWQMEFQTFAAAGRISEVLGAGANNRYLKYDRSMRRLGMIYAAEQSLKAAEENPASKLHFESYAAGVNAYIDQLTPRQYPLEYKLLNYKPEHWSPLKTALFIKYMSYDLAGKDDDFEYTNARKVFSKADYERLYPLAADSLRPIVPNSAESPYPTKSSLDLSLSTEIDSLYFNFKLDSFTKVNPVSPDKDNGSNNWAVAGSKTKSGRPILCNDPHLGLNLPSLWYEMQLSTPNMNVYGVSFPGVPYIPIGFNDDIAWAVTNAGRDVKDYFEMKFKDESLNEYWRDGDWEPTTKRVEPILVKGKDTYNDTVVYTHLGPLMYDRTFPVDSADKRNIVVRWKAHDPSNEGLTFHELNVGKNYEDYLKAIKNFTCPGQNFLFASKTGDIAIWQQGEFPAKWRRQGDFVMPQSDVNFEWKGMIPQEENPHMKNPARGYASSANQLAVDTSYPYYLGNSFPVYRGYTINRRLDEMSNISVDDMKALQVDNYNVKAEFAKSILLRTPTANMSAAAKKYFDILRAWSFKNDPGERGATIFTLWWRQLEISIWGDEFKNSNLPLPLPEENVLVESLLKDSSYSFIDNITTPQKETLEDQLILSLAKATESLSDLEVAGKLEWGKYKDTKVQHLMKLDPLSRLHLPIGGGNGIINATKGDHGPSWRMIVHLTDETEAYGVYPGGQSGNPGSKYYDSFIDSWAAGKYYRLWVMKSTEQNDRRIIGKLNFSK